MSRRDRERKILKLLKSISSAETYRDMIQNHGLDAEDADPQMIMKVKYRDEVKDVYDVPLDSTNEELIGKLLQEFMKCEVRLPGEKRPLVQHSKSFTLKKWAEKKSWDPEDTIRAVLVVKEDLFLNKSDGMEASKIKKLEEENEDLKTELARMKTREREHEEKMQAMKKLNERLRKQNGEECVVHHLIWCDKCGVKPVVGRRYNLRGSSPNYDLCGKCWNMRKDFGKFGEEWLVLTCSEYTASGKRLKVAPSRRIDDKYLS